MAKKRKLGRSRFPDAASQVRPPKKQKPSSHGQAQGGKPSQQTQKKHQHKQYHSNQEPVIPFLPDDPILLIGEGDLSFAASLAVHHRCTNITATVQDKNEEALLEKYPHAGANISKILEPKRGGVPAVDTSNRGRESASDVEEEEEEDQEDSDPGASTSETTKTSRQTEHRNRIIYNTDATTLKHFTTKPRRPRGSPPPPPPPPPPSTNKKSRPPPQKHQKQQQEQQKQQQKTGLFQHIIFNFPHVGGLTTDQTRQVRHNQSLLLSFFRRALPSLRPHGAVVVTLFEGEPYTLWNVKDLAGEAGLGFEGSFKFPWVAYPGYRHARTCGVVRGNGKGRDGNDDDNEEKEKEQDDEDDDDTESGSEGNSSQNGKAVKRKGESKSAWKGEERAARSYVFRRKEEVGIGIVPRAAADKAKKSKKRKAGAGGSDSDSDADSDF